MDPCELTLTPTDVTTLMGGLVRCSKATSSKGTPKAAIPVYRLARYYAAMAKQYVYLCGTHWHLTNAVPRRGTRWQSPPCKPHNIEIAIQVALTHSQKVGLRMQVYGEMDAHGRWYYYAREVLDLRSQYKDTKC